MGDVHAHAFGLGAWITSLVAREVAVDSRLWYLRAWGSPARRSLCGALGSFRRLRPVRCVRRCGLGGMALVFGRATSSRRSDIGGHRARVDRLPHDADGQALWRTSSTESLGMVAVLLLLAGKWHIDVDRGHWRLGRMYGWQQLLLMPGSFWPVLLAGMRIFLYQNDFSGACDAASCSCETTTFCWKPVLPTLTGMRWSMLEFLIWSSWWHLIGFPSLQLSCLFRRLLLCASSLICRCSPAISLRTELSTSCPMMSKSIPCFLPLLPDHLGLGARP